MFQIERLWVRSLAPTTAARGARSGGTTSGKHKKGQGRAGNSAESCNGSQGRPSSPTSSSPVGAPSPLPPPPPRSDSSLSPTAASEAADDDRGASRDGGRVERTAYDSRSMLSPTLLYDVDNPCTTSACTSCKQNFVPEENAWNSCRWALAGGLRTLAPERIRSSKNGRCVMFSLAGGVCRRRCSFRQRGSIRIEHLARNSPSVSFMTSVPWQSR